MSEKTIIGVDYGKDDVNTECVFRVNDDGSLTVLAFKEWNHDLEYRHQARWTSDNPSKDCGVGSNPAMPANIKERLSLGVNQGKIDREDGNSQRLEKGIAARVAGSNPARLSRHPPNP